MAVSEIHQGSHKPRRKLHSLEQRRQRGLAARKRVPLTDLAEIAPLADRPDPVALLESQSADRIPDLVPIRYGRMADTPFTFFRGAALPMADDLSHTPNTGLTVWLCGDAHLSNFGFYATAERKLAFDLNDFDESYPGPFEWDVKRLAASFAIASRNNNFSRKEALKCARAVAHQYRKTMARQATKGNLDVWYTGVDAQEILKRVATDLDTSATATTRKALRKARHRNNEQAWSKLTYDDGTHRRFVSSPPLVVPIRELFTAEQIADGFANVARALEMYRYSLEWSRRMLLDVFTPVDLARKVVGVGSVGMDSWMLLMSGVADDDPLLLQMKQAQESVLQRYVPGREYKNHGERVVHGQTLMQFTSDIFLGWQHTIGVDGVTRHYYVRQLRDGKGSVVVEALTPEEMTMYAKICGEVLAHAHARGGDRVAIAAYLDDGKAFEKAIAEFAMGYEKRNRHDFELFHEAIDSGRLEAHHST